MTQGLLRRLCRRLPLLVAVAAGAWGSAARAVALPPHPVTEVHLVKAQHEGLRFHWQAVVSEEGGAFVLRRRGLRPSADVVRLASTGRRVYDAWWRAPAASGIYELRYRAANGVESVLATMLVDCHSLQSSGPVQAAAAPQWHPPAGATAFPLAAATPFSWRTAEPDARLATVPREPLLPPPRASSRA